MSLKKLFKNIKYLSKNLLPTSQKTLNVDEIIEQTLYEIPTSGIKRPKIKNHIETVQLLIESNCSLARFGDGEIQIIEGNSIGFQKYDKELAEKLKKILKNENKNLLVGINYEFYYPQINVMNDLCAHFYRYDAPALRKNLDKYINYNKQYVTTAFTQLYMLFKEYDFEKHYSCLRKIWENKKILLVTCEAGLKNIEYNIFDNAKEINYLYIPPKHAYSEYMSIYSKIKEYPNDTLIIPMAGPTAKVLALDLLSNGFRVLDLGHIMKDYDWYKKSINRTNQNLITFFAPD